MECRNGETHGVLGIGDARHRQDAGQDVRRQVRAVGAVGIARGAAVLGSVLGFAGALYNIWSVFKDGETREQKEKESRKAREEIRNAFSEGAQEVYSDLVARAREKIRESVEHDKEGVREAQRLLEAQRTLMEQRKEQLAGLLTETRTLIEEIAASRA